MDYEKRLSGTGRNDSCPCGSGKKYKKCHLSADLAERSAAFAAQKAEAEARAAEKAAEEEEGDDATPKGKGGERKGKADKNAKVRNAKGGKNATGGKGKEAGKATNIPRRGAI